MKRGYILAAAAVIAVAVPALAQFTVATPPAPQAPEVQQVQQVQQVQSPMMTVNLSSDYGSKPVSFDPANDPDRARALIQQLRKDKLALRNQYMTTLGQYQEVLARIDEMTRMGGSLVTAHCEGLLSVNTAGASENCAASGYTCASVSGLCHRQCNVTSECAPSFVCDTGEHRCVVPAPADDG